MASEGKHPVGLTKNTSWQVGARKTFPIRLEDAWQLITGPVGRSIWLGDVSKFTEGGEFQLEDGTQGLVRVLRPNSHIRMNWHSPKWSRASTLQVRVVAKGEKTVIAFHQENLPSEQSRENRKAYFKKTLSKLEDIITQEY